MMLLNVGSPLIPAVNSRFSELPGIRSPHPKFNFARRYLLNQSTFDYVIEQKIIKICSGLVGMLVIGGEMRTPLDERGSEKEV